MPNLHDTTRHRAAARDALAARTRRITGAVVGVSALLSGGFAALAAASAPGRHLQPVHAKTRVRRAAAPKPAPAHTATIPPLPPAAGPGSDAAPTPSPSPAPSAPAPTPAPPVVSSGGS